MDTSLNSPQLKPVKAISQTETTIRQLPTDKDKPLHSANVRGKTWPIDSKISRFTPISSTERSVRSIPITNTRGQKKQTGLQQYPFRPQQQEKLKQNSNICYQVTKPSTLESISPKNLRHVEKSESRPQNLTGYQKRRQLQDPTLVRIRLGLIKTGRIINSAAHLSNLEKIKGSSEENNLKIQSDGHPAVSEKLQQPIHSKIMLGEAKQILRPTMMCQKPPQASAEGKRQLYKQSPTSPISLPKATTSQKDIFQELKNGSSPKEYSELVSSSSSRRQNRASEDCNTTNDSSNESNMMINSSQHNQTSANDNQESKPKIRPQSTASETETSVITSHYNNASDQCGRMSCFQFPLKSPRSFTECGQLSRICRPVIKRTSDSRPTYFKTPQAWRRSSSNQTANTGRDVRNSSQNRCNLSDSESSKSSSSEATLHEDYRFGRKYRGARLYKKCATSCPTKFVGKKHDAAVHPELSGSPSTHTNFEILECSMAGCMPQCPFTLDQQQEPKHTVHTTDCDRFREVNHPWLREQEDPPPLQPSVAADMRSEADVQSCPEECVSTGECKDKLLELH